MARRDVGRESRTIFAQRFDCCYYVCITVVINGSTLMNVLAFFDWMLTWSKDQVVLLSVLVGFEATASLFLLFALIAMQRRNRRRHGAAIRELEWRVDMLEAADQRRIMQELKTSPSENVTPMRDAKVRSGIDA